MIGSEEIVKVETTRGLKMVPKKYINFTQNKQETVTIQTKDGRSIPLLLKSVPVVFKKDAQTDADEGGLERKKITIQKVDAINSIVLRNKIAKKTANRKTLHSCELCGKKFANENKFKYHMANHENKSAICTICKKKFKNLATLQKHSKIHIHTKHVCKICNVSLASKNVLEIHIRRHKGEYTHKCEECGKEYYNSKAFNHHMEAEHVGIRYPCEICGSLLKSKRYYKDHMSNHANKDPRTFECNICHKYYSTKSALNGHMRIHSGERYVCHICGKKSIQKGAHNGHMRMHAGEKSYICELCGRDFLRKDVLDQHMRKVHETSKIPCKKCGLIFITEYQLMVHLHTHADIEKPFPCQLCDEKFIDKNFLRNHVNKIHIENKDSKPPKKNKNRTPKDNKNRTPKDNKTPNDIKTPKDNKSLNDIKISNDNKREKIYTCDDCGATVSAAFFDYHKQIHLLNKSFTCNICKENFIDVKELKTHLLTHESDIENEFTVNAFEDFVGKNFDYNSIVEDVVIEEETPYVNQEIIIEELVSL